MTKICAHVLVKNEVRFVWYSVMSVIDAVDYVLIYDTGSTDGTWEILQTIAHNPQYKNKVILKKYDKPFDEEKIRQSMLDETDADWFIVVDGDEIWWNQSINKICAAIKEQPDKYESIVVPTVNPVGDIFHYQEERAGNYTFFGKTGHYAIRAISMKIPGLHSLGTHGVWGWVDENNKMIQARNESDILFLDTPYMHMTYLERTISREMDRQVVKRSFKRKEEIGISFPLDYFYPESFFYNRPKLVPNVWGRMDKNFLRKALVKTPLRKIKRRILPRKVGY